MKKMVLIYVVAGLCHSIPAAEVAWPPPIPLGDKIRFNWTRKDSLGFTWDITAAGTVNDGTSDTYDNGMLLSVNGSNFCSPTEFGSMLKNKSGICIGPWREGDIEVYRYIFVHDRVNYCLWLDVFMNHGEDTRADITYYSNLGATFKSLHTTTGATKPTIKDWGMVTENISTRSDLIHLWGTKHARVLPSVSASGDDITCQFKVDLKKNTPVALCLIECQRNDGALAREEMSNFPFHEIAKSIPLQLRTLLVNMPAVYLDMGDTSFPRNKVSGLLTLMDGNQLTGKIINEKFTIQTPFARLDLEPEKVVGFYHPQKGDKRVLLVLTDSQILAGQLLQKSISIQTVDNNIRNIPLNKITSVAYPISQAKPEYLKSNLPMIALRTGARLTIGNKGNSFPFLTNYGRVDINPGDLDELLLDTPAGSLHTAIFANGSSLSGLMLSEEMKYKLSLGAELSIPTQHIASFIFPDSPGKENMAKDKLVAIYLANGDVLYGTLVSESLSFCKSSGKSISLPYADIVAVRGDESQFMAVTVTTRDGNTFVGKFIDKNLPLKISEKLIIPVYTGHITEIQIPEKKQPPEQLP